MSSRLHHRYARPPLWPTSPAEVLAAHPARFGPLARALQFCPNLRFLPCMAEWPRTIAACTLCSLTFVPAFSQYFFGSGCCYSLLFLSLLFLAADPLAAGPRCQSSMPSLPSSLLSSLPSSRPRCHPLVLAAILSSSLPSSRPRCRPRCHPRSSLPVLDAIAAVFAAIRAARLLVRSRARLLASASACERICLRARLLASASEAANASACERVPSLAQSAQCAIARNALSHKSQHSFVARSLPVVAQQLQQQLSNSSYSVASAAAVSQV